MTKGSVGTVNIKPGVSILSVLRHLNYKPWFALAEFVDNAIQSYNASRDALRAVDPHASPLKVTIEFNDTPPGEIVIRDNAGGISLLDFERAFRPAAIPLDRNGLSEFGMGMKSAACWFAPNWEVRTSAIGEPLTRTVRFDIARIVDDNVSVLAVIEEPEDANSHFTEIRLIAPFKMPTGRTTGKISEHLTDIYRVFIRNRDLELRLGSTILSYSPPAILSAPYFRAPESAPVSWRKDIDFSFGNGLSVKGFAALRDIGSTSRAGFALFRRGRLIQGSADEGYRPELIFGRSNSYTYQRLFGELHLEGFEVSHTKDGFRWDENELPFLELLKEHLTTSALPLLQQAEGFRSRRHDGPTLEFTAQVTVNSTADVLNRTLPTALQSLDSLPPAPATPTPALAPSSSPNASRDISVAYRGQQWRIHLEAITDPAIGDWLSISDGPTRAFDSDERLLGIRVSLVHPFMVRFMGANAEELEGLFRVAAAVGLAEVLAREAGVRLAGTVVRNINSLLRESMSQQ